MRYLRLDCALLLLSSIAFFGQWAYGEVSLELTTQNSTTQPAQSQNIEDLFYSSRQKSPEKKGYLDVDLTTQQNITPTSYPAITVNRSQILPFSTTLSTSQGSLNLNWHTVGKWMYGGGFSSSEQTGSGTPDTTSAIWNINFGRTIEYFLKNKNDHPLANSADDEDPYKAAYAWKVTLGTGSISAASFPLTAVQKNITSTTTIAAASVVQSSMTIDLSWDPREWVTLEGSYQQFGYANDPNVLAPAKLPKRGSPTSLENFEDMALVTFHLNDYWDLEAKGTYDITATADQTSSDEETYTLSYYDNWYELGVGYDHQDTGGIFVDSWLVKVKGSFK